MGDFTVKQAIKVTFFHKTHWTSNKFVRVKVLGKTKYI